MHSVDGIISGIVEMSCGEYTQLPAQKLERPAVIAALRVAKEISGVNLVMVPG